MSTQRVHVVGAGLAGSEAAYQLARWGIPVVLHEMRPTRMTEAHHTGGFAELVCSNSLKSKDALSAPGMLKAEMSRVGSLILECAAKSEVPGGQALAVDRGIFSDEVTARLRSHPGVTVESGEVTEPFKDGITLFATGPLTSSGLAQWLQKATGENSLYFYDAIAPIVDASTIDLDKAFLANRYDKGEEEAYLNCPLNEAEYAAFLDALTKAEKVTPKDFEKEKFFAGCQPIEAIAATGPQSLRFGPMKPAGLTDPRTGRWPHAVVQLRPENRARTAYNLVGFQTKLKYGEQSRVFRMIPALHRAEFLRLGSIHRNTYVCGPRCLRPDLSLKGHPRVYLAGQVTGVEGYLESAAIGLLAGLFVRQRLEGKPHAAPPANTALGALLRHVTATDPARYQPGNMHFGLFDPILFDGLSGSPKDVLRKGMAEQALGRFGTWLGQAGPPA
ncbi:MAG TPA: methylenetetrahydrofolate--tRNA-(uracil(54)-C(5))-methyltransferase (FADH(2)-oxidizing) TrmFO [Bdellovibrionota bacterium]|jgi:methylenetetrahydrofolate--tRNA-(uracil-5-)-methyltransferase|nr:methylenetetrahydrofolate--tRNA-(uracil(54)-C(5))-methyltransferase (FADH(2)-oxidizing) TrmFO [Bdellovibrionota bacterium]